MHRKRPECANAAASQREAGFAVWWPALGTVALSSGWKVSAPVLESIAYTARVAFIKNLLASPPCGCSAYRNLPFGARPSSVPPGETGEPGTGVNVPAESSVNAAIGLKTRPAYTKRPVLSKSMESGVTGALVVETCVTAEWPWVV